jgi:hypothetical protein
MNTIGIFVIASPADRTMKFDMRRRRRETKARVERAVKKAGPSRKRVERALGRMSPSCRIMRFPDGRFRNRRGK